LNFKTRKKKIEDKCSFKNFEKECKRAGGIDGGEALRSIANKIDIRYSLIKLYLNDP